MFSLKNRFEIGLANLPITPILKYQEYINSFFIGLPVSGNCRFNYIKLTYLDSLLQECDGIPVWVTINSPAILPGETERMLDLLIGIHDKYKFHGYIVSDIVLLSELKNRNIPVQVSTVNDIRDLNDVSRYHEMGFKNIVLSYKVNRNLEFIQKAVKTFPDIQFTLITNELCESDCPHRCAHFMITSMNQLINYECPIRNPDNTLDRKQKILQNTVIPPENLQYYPENIIFKLPTRMRKFTTEDIAKHLSIYAGLEPYDNYWELVSHHVSIKKYDAFLVDKQIYKYWLNCKNQCYECKVCENEINRIRKIDTLQLLNFNE